MYIYRAEKGKGEERKDRQRSARKENGGRKTQKIKHGEIVDLTWGSWPPHMNDSLRSMLTIEEGPIQVKLQPPKFRATYPLENKLQGGMEAT